MCDVAINDKLYCLFAATDHCQFIANLLASITLCDGFSKRQKKYYFINVPNVQVSVCENVINFLNFALTYLYYHWIFLAVSLNELLPHHYHKMHSIFDTISTTYFYVMKIKVLVPFIILVCCRKIVSQDHP